MASNRFNQYSGKKLSSITLEAIATTIKNDPCIFLSHQKGDREAAKNIANYLIEQGVSVYFDEYDEEARLANQSQNPKAVTAAILRGIQLSSHMLCIVSANTIKSSWVPFEIGYGYEKTQMGVLMLKGIDFRNLPDYIKSVEIIIRDIYDINKFLEKVSLFYRFEKKQNNYGDFNHPLINQMERIIT